MLISGAQPLRISLRSIKLERFKATFKPDPIALRPFNVLIGRNSAGKSTLLEALQWLDTTVRQDARAASDRYYGVRDLINLRGDASWFGIKLVFAPHTDNEGAPDIGYQVSVAAEEDGTPRITEEWLWVGKDKPDNRYIWVNRDERRWLWSGGASTPFLEPDRLALSRGDSQFDPGDPANPFPSLRAFFRDAVFLRLSPNRLAKGSPARRRSFDPLLDEEGQMLPALLYELTDAQRQDLIERVQRVLPGMQDVQLEESSGRDTVVNYALLERMPYRGKRGRRNFPIPSWMLSEGTRRITALFALLVHDPPPSLLCVEEVENGLDPHTAILVLQELRSAADRGTQVLITTHNPWLLDHVELDDILEARRQDGNTVYGRFADRAEIQAYAPDVSPGTRFINEAR